MALTLDPKDRLHFLEALATKVEEYVTKQQHRLHLEYEFLDLVLQKQGFQAAGRVSANMDKLKALASVQELLPNFMLGKYRKESDEDKVVDLPKEDK